MLSYQHSFHAGNYADILKHLTLTLILDSLCRKDKPFTVIDSHAGRGVYSLDCDEARKTNEAADGIEKLFSLTENKKIPPVMEHYLSLEKLYYLKRMYAGSPEIEKLLLREQDALFLIEKHPQEIEALKQNAKKNVLTESDFSPLIPKEIPCRTKVNVFERDSWEALRALTPPKIKRGLVLTDPSYETLDDYTKARETLSLVSKKWNTAIIALWYPLLSTKQHQTTQMITGIEDSVKTGVNPCECMNVEFIAKDIPSDDSKAHMYGSGMFIVNPPWMLKEQLEQAVEFLSVLK